jgi:hypothetical protein
MATIAPRPRTSPIEQRLALEHVEDRERRGASDRVATIGAADRARRDGVHHLSRSYDGGDR